MEDKEKQLEAIQDIRKMMMESSKFISLSGLSGILAGIYALLGVWAGISVIQYYYNDNSYIVSEKQVVWYFFFICLTVLILSLASALILTRIKAKKQGVKLFDHTSKKLAISMMVPLLVGGITCFAFLYHGGSFLYLICPVMLIFYGISLVSSDKYTIHAIRWLGYSELLLGLLALFYLGNGILFWSLGFGILHILYGGIMWIKYDSKL